MVNHRRLLRRLKPRVRRRSEPGTKPGTLNISPDARPTTIRVMAYSNDQLIEQDVANPRDLQPLLKQWPVVWVDVVGLLHADDAQLMDRFGRWYIPRREPRYLRRNALVVLGNIGDGADPSVERAVAASLGSPDPIVRAHAVWAARRLGLHGLVEQLLADEHDPVVMEEVGRVVASRLSRGHQ